MLKTCQACNHPEKTAIEEALGRGEQRRKFFGSVKTMKGRG